MSKKKNLKTPVYMNHDLTPEEDFAAKQLRYFGKAQITAGKTVKFGYLKVYVNGIPHKYDTESKAIISSSSTTGTTQASPHPTHSLSSPNPGIPQDFTHGTSGPKNALLDHHNLV